MSIQNRFVVPVVAMVSILPAFTLQFFPSRERVASTEALKNKAQSIAQMLAYNIAAGLQFENPESVLMTFGGARAVGGFKASVMTERAGWYSEGRGELQNGDCVVIGQIAPMRRCAHEFL